MKTICCILLLFVLSVKAANLGQSMVTHSRFLPSTLDCNFTDSSMCKWSNDQNNWPINWELDMESDLSPAIHEENSGSVCLYSTELSQQMDISSRLFSPLMSAASNVFCLKLVYKITMSRHPLSTSADQISDTSPKLALLRRQMGVIHLIIIYSTIVFRKSFIQSQSIFSIQPQSESLDDTSDLSMDLNCEFRESTCNWSNDQNNWPANWKLIKIELEDSSKNDLVVTEKKTSICLTIGKLSAPHHQYNYDITARLFSPIVSVMKQPSCVKFTYNIQLNSVSSRDVYGFSAFDLEDQENSDLNERQNHYLDCDFDDLKSEFCNWLGDPRNDKALWKNSRLPGDSNNRVICLQPKPSHTGFRKISNIHQQNTLTARLWSETVEYVSAPDGDNNFGYSLSSPQKNFRCLQFQYKLQLRDTDMTATANHQLDDTAISLSLLKHSTGSCHSDIGVNTGIVGVVCANDHLWNSSITNTNSRIPSIREISKWKTVKVELSGQSDYKLILEGTIPAGYPDARICVDNITSYTEPCSALEKASAPLTNQWSWAQYFGLTFVGALILGLLIPVLFLIILIWACRRRHHAMHSNYTNNKLFSTNLWYYIGGKEICDDPNGFRGSSSLLRSKQFNSPSNTGTLLNGVSGQHHMMMSNADVMDLPDVVIPGGRVVAFNYSGNTLGGNTLRHNSMANNNNTGFTNTGYLSNNNNNTSNLQNGQVMLGNINGTVSSSGSGVVNATTVARSCQNSMPLVSTELIQQQSQNPTQQQPNEPFAYPTNQAFGEPVSMTMLTASQSPMLMTQSMAPNYGSDANNASQGIFSNTNAPQMNHFNTNAHVYNKPQGQQQQQQNQQQPRAQSQYFPPAQLTQAPNAIQQQPQLQPQQQQQQHQGPQVFQQPAQPQQTPQIFQQPTQQQQQQQQISGFQNQNLVQQSQPQQQQQQLAPNQAPVSNQFHTQQQQQFPLPPPPTSQQLQQLNTQQSTVYSQPQPQPQQPVNHPFQFQPQQNQPQHQQQVINGQLQTPMTTGATQIPSSQQNYQPTVQRVMPVSANNRFVTMSPTSVGSDSLTEADQQAAMALLAAATEGMMDTYNRRENQTTPSTFQSPISNNNNNNNGTENCLNSVNNLNNCNSNNNTQVSTDEDHPPPGYDEAIGLIQNNINMSMMMNTMAKPAVPIPNTTCTPPPALPPRRIINGVGLEDIEDPQPMACLSLAERYGLPVAEI
uniref:MAM domain-containing protein n=1 Tax=Trichobilharzia regenti TaxID=157069 RepID=A0AA85JM56_TRIRE|nr:unnamed protein product [Trichobilharzia regenti]